jgi:eukaryotic-like serine/threonine-protein kinase
MSTLIEPGAEPIPGYKLLHQLGSGGFGEVWQAEGPGGAPKAVKVLFGSLDNLSDKAGNRARQELKSLKRIQAIRHPFLLSLERYDIIDGQLIIVTELADRSLWDRFQECRGQGLPGIPREELLGYVEEAAEALDLMNQRHRLQHLDVKPQNLLLCFNHVKVADFGLVKYLEEANVTRTGGFTPTYAAPELFQGTVSRSCDQYSLALVFQELLTGQRPFAGNSPAELARQHISEPPNLSALEAGDRPAIARALAKRPDDRHPSCTDLVRGLRGAPAADASRRESGPGQAQTVQDVVTGKGLLCPTLVIGLGGQGLRTLHLLRKTIHDRFGTVRALPNVRLLVVDTDLGGSGPDGESDLRRLVGENRALAAPLHRPPHYFQPGGDRPLLDRWLDQKLIYQMTREPKTGGWRGLGRLALVDHYRAIAARVRSELEACAATTALQAADQQTGLGLRSNQPRVTIVTSLAGGTGSGMFLDVAYIVRHALQDLGFLQGQVIGLFILPAGSDKNRQRGLANTAAALIELHHFSSAQTSFTAGYRADLGLNDAGPPFHRWCLLPGDGNPEPAAPPAERAADYLYAELTTSLARRGDDEPPTVTQAFPSASTAPEVLPPSASSQPPAMATFGIQRVTFPRRKIVRRVARRLCADLLRSWLGDGPATLGPAVQTWLAEHWTKESLGAESLVGKLEQSLVRLLGPSPLDTFRDWIESEIPKERSAGVDPRAIRGLLERIDAALGRPGEQSSALSTAVAPLTHWLEEAGSEWMAEWAERYRELIRSLLDRPSFRFAGANLAMGQAQTTVAQLAQHYGSVAGDLAAKVEQSGLRLEALLRDIQQDSGRGRRAAARITELVELLPRHVKWRCEGKVLGRVGHVFHGLREVLIDCRQEIDFCRTEMARLAQELTPANQPGDPDDDEEGPAPADGSADSEVRRFLEGLKPREREELEQDVSAMISKQYESLAALCFQTSWGNRFAHLASALRHQAEVFAQDRIGFPDVIEKFLAGYPVEAEARAALGRTFARAEAALGPANKGAATTRVAALPASPLRDTVWNMACACQPSAPPAAASSLSDLIIYVERATSFKAVMDHLGSSALQAYRQVMDQQSSPHSRLDVADWLALPNDDDRP